MILNSIDKQFRLADSGEILWQKDLTNPMPGVPVAVIAKGEGPLNPLCRILENENTSGQDSAALQTFIHEWLGRHLKAVLEPLFNLKDEKIAEGAPRDICEKLFQAMGLLPREDLQDLIQQMDDEKRATLRSKKIRFGPMIVYLPELNKPAAVRLRALLLSLWQDKTLPADIPADGIVSFSVADKQIDENYYRAIGYPVYGPRAVRVDMLDRVICAVYDGSKDGKFTAKHQMAEWLGSNIPDLYAVLEAMGHQKIEEPTHEVKPENEAAPVPPAEGEAKPAVKPELATFRLKRGKPKAASAGQGHEKPKKNFSKPDEKKFKPPAKSKSKKGGFKPEPREKIYRAEVESKPEDSPFAILQQLKISDKK